ncbi:hypothetical protein ANN_03143 [Periplaneta americana]|uniref:Transposase n=1 Tax=Periplaneta americana TaxID=6978 RepID=A0ABQ8TZE9_PERAM|nr:hypothetical protein ANN_03143 [Periplaneta americana]
MMGRKERLKDGWMDKPAVSRKRLNPAKNGESSLIYLMWPRPISRLLASRSHSETEVDDHPTRMQVSCVSDIQLFENHGRQSHVIHQHSHANATKMTLGCSRINETYPGRWISRGGVISWPQRSPDLTPLDYCVWSYLKSEVYKRKVETSVDGIDDSEMVFGEMRPRIRHRLPEICLAVGQNLGKTQPGAPRKSRLVPVAWQQWSEMEALIPSPAACEVRSVIKFFNAQSIAPIEIHRQLSQVYGPNIMSKQMVRRWCRQFSEGRQSVHDEERSGRPTLINDDRVELVRQCIMENRRFTITELSSHFPQISRSLLHEIVTKHLLLKKCVPGGCRKPDTRTQMQRLGAALTFLQLYHDDGDEFLDRIVTGDETWISHFTPKTKQQSMHWRHSGSPVRTKFKQTLSVRKVMCTVFWDRKGILLIVFLPRGETVNADRYCETLQKLRRAIQNKRREMLTAGVVLLHDNARPHTARRTAAVLTEFGW